MRIDILTLFPEMLEAVMSQSIIARARQSNIIEINTHQIRDYTENRQNQVDDYPYGGGMGMVMMAQPIVDTWRAVCEQAQSKPFTIYMSPQGKVLTQQKAIDLSEKKHICVICGHYEGIDQRVIDSIVDMEISIGDYVLTGGELPALVLVDTVARLVPQVLADQQSIEEESHYPSQQGKTGILEYPHYTRPAEWEGMKVPEVLLSGHHAKIENWRRQKALEITLERREDLLKSAGLSQSDVDYVNKLKAKKSENNPIKDA